MKTIISHFYNEEYLLPWWLNHHKKFFDHGILINYASTDNSVNIIKEICPNWTIHNSKNNNFQSDLVDQEVQEYEKGISDWRVCLNTTEFLVGDYSTLISDTNRLDKLIQIYIMLESKESLKSNSQPIDLLKEKRYGGPPLTEMWSCRSLHNYSGKRYPLGRHFALNQCNCDDFIILKYMYSPWNDKFIQRKLQISSRIPEHDNVLGLGHHHHTTKEKLEQQMQDLLQNYPNHWSDVSEVLISSKTPLSEFL